MAEAFLEAFPSMPTLDFLTTKKEMAKARQRAELVLEASGACLLFSYQIIFKS
jgi:hypothetical protein